MSFKYKYNYASPDRYNLLKEFAQKNKQFSTEAENLIWQYLRKNGLGVKFNRQYVIYDYIVDFICLEKKLIIEIDGGYHLQGEQPERDEERTAELMAQGFKVLRFSNEEVLCNIDSVLEQISKVLGNE